MIPLLSTFQNFAIRLMSGVATRCVAALWPVQWPVVPVRGLDYVRISTVGVAEVNLCFYCTALTRIHTIHTVRAEGSLVRSDSGLELVQALLPAGRLQAADRRLI